jgi:hypothetical protein
MSEVFDVNFAYGCGDGRLGGGCARAASFPASRCRPNPRPRRPARSEPLRWVRATRNSTPPASPIRFASVPTAGPLGGGGACALDCAPVTCLALDPVLPGEQRCADCPSALNAPGTSATPVAWCGRAMPGRALVFLPGARSLAYRQAPGPGPRHRCPFSCAPRRCVKNFLRELAEAGNRAGPERRRLVGDRLLQRGRTPAAGP